MYVYICLSAKTSNRNTLLNISKRLTLNLMKISGLVLGNTVYILECLNKNYVIIMTSHDVINIENRYFWGNLKDIKIQLSMLNPNVN